MIPFKVEEDTTEVYAAVFDYTGVANLGLTILRDNSADDEFEINSVPGKYHSFIKPVSLSKGSYLLLIEPESRNYKDPSKAD